jgi:hypothetical protein
MLVRFLFVYFHSCLVHGYTALLLWILTCDPLSLGDRLVKVNGESIIGKTYSQVIGLIQNR